MPPDTHASARAEFHDVLDWYLARDLPRARDFRDAYDAALACIAADPLSLPVCQEVTDPGVRYQRLEDFPYRVLFRAAGAAGPKVLALLPLTAGPAWYRRAERRG